MHVLLIVPPAYFSHGYIKQAEWQRQWQMAGRYDYAPVIDIRRARAKENAASRIEDAKMSAIEAAKYTTKATDLLSLREKLPEFIKQMRGHRLTSVSRALGRLVPAHEPIEQEMADERDHSQIGLHPTVSLLAQWDSSLSDYMLLPR